MSELERNILDTVRGWHPKSVSVREIALAIEFMNHGAIRRILEELEKQGMVKLKEERNDDCIFYLWGLR